MARLPKYVITEAIAADLVAGQRCVLPGLGVLKIVRRKARRVRHPVTGVIYRIEARDVIVFRAARKRR